MSKKVFNYFYLRFALDFSICLFSPPPSIKLLIIADNNKTILRKPRIKTFNDWEIKKENFLVGKNTVGMKNKMKNLERKTIRPKSKE